jgi:RNA polymerase sigma factor (sigma-70 family)
MSAEVSGSPLFSKEAAAASAVDGRAIIRDFASRRVGKSYFAIVATAEEITLPEFEPLGYLTQSRLIQRAQRGDIEAKQTVWLRNARLTYSVANRIGMPPMLAADAIQVGQIALERAILKFDVDRLNELSTYAFAAVRQRMRRFIARHTAFVAVPAHLALEYQRFRHEVPGARSRETWFDARQRYLESDPEQYQTLLKLHAVAQPSRITPKARRIPAPATPADEILRSELFELTHRAVDDLPHQQAVVIRRRYGLGDEVEHTLEEVGRKLGITRERVRQIQERAENTLWQVLAAYGWTARDLAQYVFPTATALRPSAALAAT